ncbi:terminase large subunit [Achromobacter phage JWF]|uniref:terminase large subunit n=1 Tax=Achromobacter phage JWF TaxID=1589748 RepID=UPI000588E4FC|nr:terminase large subunit [Achromobacter phage JWF]AJD82901.1 terminase large subunit [Achromobacter phage JWF]
MSNQYLQSFLDRCANRYSTDRAGMTTGDWMIANTRLHDRPFSFDRYPFQKQIADDMHRDLNVIKPSQVGLTEIQIRKVLAFITRYKGVNVIYTLPNEKMFEKISTGRIRPIVDNDKVFNLEQVGNSNKPSRSKSIIQVGRSFMYITGAGEGDATATSADMVANDEVDLTDQAMLGLFNSRLQGSDWGLNHKFSTPTFEGYGIDQQYNNSDQHEYFYKCEHCNHHQVPIFNKKFVRLDGLSESVEFEELEPDMLDDGAIDFLGMHIMCEKCHKKINVGDHSRRQWVAKYPNRVHSRGYRVRTFSTERLTPQYVIQQLFKYKQADNLRGWHNTVLGQANEGGNERLSVPVIHQCFTHEMLVKPPLIGVPAWLGIDMGQTVHIVVGQGFGLKDLEVREFISCPVGELPLVINRIMDTYRLWAGGCDRHPYTPTADAVWEQTNRRVLPIEYRGQKEVNIVKDASGTELYAQANRTILLDDVARVVRQNKIRFSGYGTQKNVITEHLRDMVREESPETEATWRKLSNNDHYFHALGFMITAIKIKTEGVGSKEAQEVRSTVAVAGVSYAQSPDSNLFLPLGQLTKKMNHGNQAQTLFI